MSSDLLGLVGLVLIATSSYVLEGPRVWVSGKSRHLGVLVSCSMCMGFWFGLAYAIAHDLGHIERKLLFAGEVSLACYAADSVLVFLERFPDGVLQKDKESGAEARGGSGHQAPQRDEDEGP